MCRDQNCVVTTGAFGKYVTTFGCRGDMSPTRWRLYRPRPQMAGFLTSKRIWGCTTFVDHGSDYIYVHLMKDLTLPEILLAKMNLNNYVPEPTGQLNIIMLIMVNSQTQHCLPPAIISTKQLIFAELAHTIKMEFLKIEINSSHKELEFYYCMA